jgi:hypothetical protein
MPTLYRSRVAQVGRLLFAGRELDTGDSWRMEASNGVVLGVGGESSGVLSPCV